MATGGTAGATQLPPVDEQTGFLPPGLHPCSWDELVSVFVDAAPHSDHRRRRLRALEVYVECVDELLPASTLWVDGGFVSYKADPPFDVDVVVKAKPKAWAAVMKEVQVEEQAFTAWVQCGQQGYPPKTPKMMQLVGLSTMHMVRDGNGVLIPRVQPFGGLVDGFVIPADQKKALDSFRRDWGVDAATKTKKGIVEVKPDAR